ncbi:MAG: cytochrome C oxidase subunit IV family protein [Planctomycetaceae bacterium]|nr:cytochrome C oxidase subunit IV family protein [Planctomycetaceae bacterium]
MADHAHPIEDPELEADIHEHHAPGGLTKYLAVFVALCVLTGISYAVGNSQALRENSPGVMWAMMMAVSCLKALLVILCFMHLWWEANWKYVLTIPASLMSLFLLLMLVPDIGRRIEKYAEERWFHAPIPQIHHAHDHAPGEGASHDDHAHQSASHEPASGAPPAGGHREPASTAGQDR